MWYNIISYLITNIRINSLYGGNILSWKKKIIYFWGEDVYNKLKPYFGKRYMDYVYILRSRLMTLKVEEMAAKPERKEAISSYIKEKAKVLEDFEYDIKNGPYQWSELAELWRIIDDLTNRGLAYKYKDMLKNPVEFFSLPISS